MCECNLSSSSFKYIPISFHLFTYCLKKSPNSSCPSNEGARKVKQEKCHGRPPAGSTDHPFWGPYRRFVKGEMARSALEKASYMDIVYGCPLDAMHFLYGGIWKTSVVCFFS